MNIFEKSTRLKLRVNTSKGVLSVEQLWDLNLTTLAETIKVYKQDVKKDDDLDFLSEESTKVDEKAQLSFEILKSIYLTKKQELQDARSAADNKEHNRRIDELILRKKEKELEDMSIGDLEKLRK